MSSTRQTRKQKRPRLLAYAAKGDYGDIHYPTLPCKDSERTPQPPEDYVSKSMTLSEAMKEIRQTSEWRRKGFNFTLVPEEVCQGEGTLRAGQGKSRRSLGLSRYLLISKYGGLPARSVSKDFIEQARRMKRYINALLELRKNVQQMNNENFFHNDITDQNITYDEEKGKAFLIDFEFAGRKAKQPPSSLPSNNSYRNLDLNDETIFIDNTINYFLDSLDEAGITINGMKAFSRSSTPRSSRTRKQKRPHSL